MRVHFFSEQTLCNILDHKPLMGEDPRVRGFFHGCGFNSGGMMFGE